MWWECGECGCQIVRERPPVVCSECGRAGASFVRVVPDLDDAEVSSLRGTWFKAGCESDAFWWGEDAA